MAKRIRFLILALSIGSSVFLPITLAFCQTDSVIQTKINNSFVVRMSYEKIDVNLAAQFGFVEIVSGAFLGFEPSSQFYVAGKDTVRYSLGYDIILIQSYHNYADNSGDGKVNIGDVTNLIASIFLGIDPFAALHEGFTPGDTTQ